MKLYQETLKTVIPVFIILVVIVAFCLFFRDTLVEITTVSWKLVLGEAKPVCTPQERLEYLDAHPNQIKLAMIGNWASGKVTRKPRQDILRLAIQRINQHGGINGRLIVPEWMETGNSIDNLHKFVDQVAHDPSFYAIIGPSTSGQLLSIKPLLLAYKLLTIAPAISNTNVTLPEDPPYIFLPNSSDEQDVLALREWATKGQRNKFILISENQPFSMGYSAHAERLFFERDITISARTFFNPSDNIRFFLDELKNYSNYFNIQNALIVNYTSVEGSYDLLAKWMLANTKGDVFSYKLLPGNFSNEDLKRMYSIVYFPRDIKIKFFMEELCQIPNAAEDAFAPAAYRCLFLLADAFRQAKTMHQQDVIEVMCNNELCPRLFQAGKSGKSIGILNRKESETPYDAFRFNNARFEAKPIIRIVSVYQLRQDWNAIRMQTLRIGKSDLEKK